VHEACDGSSELVLGGLGPCEPDPVDDEIESETNESEDRDLERGITVCVCERLQHVESSSADIVASTSGRGEGPWRFGIKTLDT